MIVVPCPNCRTRKVARSVATFPVCSVECREHDLAGWTEERYRIAGEKSDPHAEENETHSALGDPPEEYS